MNIEWNGKTIAIIAVISVLFIGTNVGQYFLIWGPKQKQMQQAYEQQIAILQDTLERIGPMVDIWTVKENIEELHAGKQIDVNDLEVKQIPESLINRSFVLDPEPIIGKYYRINLKGGTPLSWDVIMEDPVDDTTREYDIYANVLPIGLRVGDYVDFRIVYPMGEDYIVLPHKRIEAIHEKSVKFKLNETEIHFYQAALLDYFLQSENGAILYLTKYIEPGVQKPATHYYAVPKNILAIMTADPNIVSKISASLNETTRKMIESGTANVPEDSGGAISSGRNEIAGNIEQGAKTFADEEQKRLEAEAKAQAEANLGRPESSSAPAAGSGPATNNPLLNVEEGVVE